MHLLALADCRSLPETAYIIFHYSVYIAYLKKICITECYGTKILQLLLSRKDF